MAADGYLIDTSPRLFAFHREHCDPFINDRLTRISISCDRHEYILTSHEPRVWERFTHTKVVSFSDDLLSILPLRASLCSIYNPISRIRHNNTKKRKVKLKKEFCSVVFKYLFIAFDYRSSNSPIIILVICSLCYHASRKKELRGK